MADLMSNPTQVNEHLTDQRRRVRRNALLLILLAAGVYLTFIAYAVTRGLHAH
jgi:hypothetical protein